MQVGKLRPKRGDGTGPMSHGKLGAEPGCPSWNFFHYATWSPGWKGSTERMRNVKRRSRLKTDKTNIYILCEEKDREETVPQISALQLPPPWQCCLPFHGRKVRASVGWRSPRTPVGPQTWSLHPGPEVTHPGTAGAEPRTNILPEVCSGCMAPAKPGMPERNSRWPSEGRANTALDPEEWGLAGYEGWKGGSVASLPGL